MRRKKHWRQATTQLRRSGWIVQLSSIQRWSKPLIIISCEGRRSISCPMARGMAIVINIWHLSIVSKGIIWMPIRNCRRCEGHSRAPAWIAAEMSVTLTQLAESSHHQASTPLLSAGADTTIQPWLQTLLQVDNRNIYGHYVLGRIHYDLHNYSACITQMMAVLQISQNMDAQSSAYTYIALSLLGQGHTAEARQLLLKAIALDPNYRNNTAREELSGLH